jgi:hypothetical protein
VPSNKLVLTLLALLLVIAGAGVFVYLKFFHGPDPARLVGLFPPGDAPTLFVNVDTLRSIGVLDMLAGKAGSEEPEYKKFVASTGFDYRRHLKAAALRFRRSETLMVIDAEFDFDKLEAYAKASNGRCANHLCSMTGSTPQRQISWLPMKGGMLGLAVSTDPMAAALLSATPAPLDHPLPKQAVWLEVPGTELHGGPGLPPGLSALLSNLEGAHRATLAIVPSATDLSLTLDAPCPTAETATQVVTRLRQNTELFQKLLARENRNPDPSDLSGILANGTFQVVNSSAQGRWPFSLGIFN